MTKGNIIEAIRKAGAMLQTPPKSFLLEDKVENDLRALDFDFVTMQERTLALLKSSRGPCFSPDQIDSEVRGETTLTFRGMRILVRETTPKGMIALWKMDRDTSPTGRLPLPFPTLVKMIKLEETDGT